VITLRHHPSARTCGSACEMLPNGAFGGNVERGARELARALLLPSDGARELFFAHPGATGDAQIFGLLVQLLLGAPEEVDAAEGLTPSASLRLRRRLRGARIRRTTPVLGDPAAALFLERAFESRERRPVRALSLPVPTDRAIVRLHP